MLVTGGAGFIGGWTARALAAAGHRVHLLDDLSRGRRDGFLDELLDGGRVRLVEGSLTGALPDLDGEYSHVIHLAARVGVRRVSEQPYATLHENVALLAAALDLARRQPDLARFVFASTSEVYAGSEARGELPFPTPEDTPLALPDLDRPRSSYMLSKLYGEALVRHAGLPYTIVRPHNVYGPRMGRSHVVPQLLEKAHRARSGTSIEVFSVEHRRTFCFVDDAVEMLIAATFAPACAGQVLNLGAPGPELTMRELAALVIDTVGKELAIEPRPPTEGSPERRCPDTSRLEALTGRRARTPIEEGLRRTWAWYREHELDGRAPGPA